MEISKKVKILHNKYNLSISYIAETVGVSRSSVYRWLYKTSIPISNNDKKLNDFYDLCSKNL